MGENFLGAEMAEGLLYENRVYKMTLHIDLFSPLPHRCCCRQTAVGSSPRREGVGQAQPGHHAETQTRGGGAALSGSELKHAVLASHRAVEHVEV